jgi:prevent-host-death family protein
VLRTIQIRVIGADRIGSVIKYNGDMIQRTVTQAKGQLSALVEAALTGEEVILSRAGKAVVRIVPMNSDRRTREPGGLKHLVLPVEFDATSEEIIKDFEEGSPF